MNGAEEVYLMADAIFVLVGFDITGSLMGVALLEPMAAPVAKILRLVHCLSLDFLYLCTFKRWVLAGPAEAASSLLWDLLASLAILILAARDTLLVSFILFLVLFCEAWYDRCRGYGSTCSLTRRTCSAQGKVGGLVNGAEEVYLTADAILVLVGFDITSSLMGVTLLEPMAAPVAKILRLVHLLCLDFLYLCTFKRWVFARPAEAASFLLFGVVRFGLVWFGLVWFGLVWFGSVWFVWFVWFGLVWFGLVWFGLTGESRNIWRTRI